MINPLGIEPSRPRLSWWPDDLRPAETQTGFHVLAASALDDLRRDEGTLWDARRESPVCNNLMYEGAAPVAGQRVWWKVRTFDSDGLSSPWSEPAWFEWGLATTGDWSGCWIGARLMGSRWMSVPVPLLRRGFVVDRPVARARIYVAVRGTCRIEINGREVLSTDLTDLTDYRRGARYHTVDVGTFVAPGDNMIGIVLGDGWFCGSGPDGTRQGFGDVPVVIGQLVLVADDGSRQVVATDAAWRWRPSWILRADPRTGESVDMRQHLSGWSRSGTSTDGWYPVAVHGEDPGELLPALPLAQPLRGSNLVPIRERTIRGATRYEFAGPMWGSLKVRVNAPATAQVSVCYDGPGEPGSDVDEFTCGAGQTTLMAQLSPRPFRSAEVAVDEGVTLERVDAAPAGRAVAACSEFECDHPLLTQLHLNLGHAVPALFAGPMLAPDTRLPELWELRLVAPAACYVADVAAPLASRVDDMARASSGAGELPDVVPSAEGAAAGCSDALILCAWFGYRFFGNVDALRRHYGVMRRYLCSEEARFPQLIREVSPACAGRLGQASPTAACIAVTAGFFQAARTMARVAGVVGRLADLEYFEELAQRIRAAFRRRFVTPDGFLVAEDAGSLAQALQHGLLSADESGAAFERLVDAVQVAETGGCADRLAWPMVLDVLTEHGRLDLAYRLALDASPDHVLDRAAAASVGTWLYGTVGGLSLDPDYTADCNAFRRARIRPRPPLGEGFPDGPVLRTARHALDTIHGRYAVRWTLTDDAFGLEVTVPVGCSAGVVLPDDTAHEAGPGSHQFSMPFAETGDGIPVLREVSQAG